MLENQTLKSVQAGLSSVLSPAVLMEAPYGSRGAALLDSTRPRLIVLFYPETPFFRPLNWLSNQIYDRKIPHLLGNVPVRALGTRLCAARGKRPNRAMPPRACGSEAPPAGLQRHSQNRACATANLHLPCRSRGKPAADRHPTCARSYGCACSAKPALALAINHNDATCCWKAP